MLCLIKRLNLISDINILCNHSKAINTFSGLKSCRRVLFVLTIFIIDIWCAKSAVLFFRNQQTIVAQNTAWKLYCKYSTLSKSFTTIFVDNLT
jgi:hypothetical protein